MRSFAVAVLMVAVFVTTLLVGYTQANAVVCARGVHRAGCVGPLLSPTVTLTGTAISRHNGFTPRDIVAAQSLKAP